MRLPALTFALFAALTLASAAPLFGPLDDLARVDADFSVGRASSYNPTGENRDFWWFEPGEVKTLAEIPGAGVIHHLWMTVSANEASHQSRLVLRMYWDGNPQPSVEVPVGDFFGNGFGYYSPFANALFEVSSEGRARNCFIPMPFARGAKVTLENQSATTRCRVFFYVNYRQYDKLPAGLGRFHAQYRQQFPCAGETSPQSAPHSGVGNYVVVEATGAGRYLGCHLSCKNNQNSWMGEGDDMIYIDGDTFPTLYGTGTEDYFGDAWGYRGFAQPYHGLSLFLGAEWINAVHTAYRYHVQDPIVFKKSIRVTIEHGSQNDRRDDWASVGFWYQDRPVSVAGTLPPMTQRLIAYPEPLRVDGPMELAGSQLVEKVQAAGGAAEAQNLAGRGDATVNQIWFRNNRPEGRVGLLLAHAGSGGAYRLRIRPTAAPDYGIWQVYLDSLPLGTPFDLYQTEVQAGRWIDLGVIGIGPGQRLLEFRCVGKNGWSGGRAFGLAGLELAPAR